MRTERTADGPKFYSQCFLCRRDFRVGPHLYEGRRVPAWDIMMCDACRSTNWDGIVPEMHPHLMRHLAERGMEVSLNKNGWLDVPA